MCYFIITITIITIITVVAVVAVVSVVVVVTDAAIGVVVVVVAVVVGVVVVVDKFEQDANKRPRGLETCQQHYKISATGVLENLYLCSKLHYHENKICIGR